LKKITIRSLLVCLLFNTGFLAQGQMITGVWKGKINRQKVEVKIIQKGDSLTGTSYYYESATHYRRYSIKGYFDPGTNEAVWWDDQLLEEKAGRFSVSSPGKMPLLARADFNCPDGGKMTLDGKAINRDIESNRDGQLHLNKEGTTDFEDEWDYIIDNYLVGGNDPELIDSIASIARQAIPPAPPVVQAPAEKAPQKEVALVLIKPSPVSKPDPVPQPKPEPKPEPVIIQPKPDPAPVIPPSIEEKFSSRQKVFIKEIPLAGDSIELRFYDNAEIDGDSISLFLNDKLLYQHIRLAAGAWTIKLAVSDLAQSNELVMVAENMGSIPPNTSYMVAIVNGVKQDAYLASTEGSSAMIRLVKKSP
jgi:hypothetical protein